MTNEEIAASVVQIAELKERIVAAHTPENEARLRAEAKARGMKLLKDGKRIQGFALRDAKGNMLCRVSLADVDAVMRKSTTCTTEI